MSGNSSYPAGIQGFMSGEFNWEDDDFSVAALGDDYTYSSAHADYSDISDFVIDSDALDDKETVDSSFRAATVSPGPVIPLDKTVKRLVVYRDALPDTAASKLCFYIDRDVYGMLLNRPGSGTAVPIQWPSTGIYTIPS